MFTHILGACTGGVHATLWTLLLRVLDAFWLTVRSAGRQHDIRHAAQTDNVLGLV